jgi:hypothetical protein
MRAFLSAFLPAALLFPSTASACLFEASSTGFTYGGVVVQGLAHARTLRFDLALEIDGSVESVFRLDQGYALDYDGQISTRGVPHVAKLIARPRVIRSMQSLEIAIQDGFSATVHAASLDEFPWVNTRVVPESLYLRGSFTADGADVGSRVIPLVFPAGTFMETQPLGQFLPQVCSRPDGSCWYAQVVGPTFSGLNELLVSTKFEGHSYELMLTGYGWTKGHVPLWAIDNLCHGDFNADGAVDQGELDMVLLDWGADIGEPRVGDWRHESPDRVNQFALDAVLLAWGDRSPAKPMGAGTGAVPEPATILVTVVIVVACLANGTRHKSRGKVLDSCGRRP